MALTKIKSGQILSVDPSSLSVAVPIGKGGTNATTASGARTNLGLAIGSDVQAFDAQLSDIAGLTPTDGNIIIGDGSNFILESGATARTSLGLGSLATLGAVETTNIAADTLVTQSEGIETSGNFTDTKIPTTAAVKALVDAKLNGLTWKESVRAASTVNLTLSTLDAGQSLDGVNLQQGDRVLIKNQSLASENGIYTIDADGSAPARSEDMNEAKEFAGSAVFVKEGSTQADQGFVCTNDSDVNVGTTAVAFTQFTGTGAFDFRIGLVAAGGSIDVAFRTEIFTGQNFQAKSDFNTDFPIKYLEAADQNSDSLDGTARDHFNGISPAPRASGGGSADRQNLPVQVFLNGILVTHTLLADNAGDSDIEDAIDTTGTENSDCVMLMGQTSQKFKLIFNSADIVDADIVTLVYGLG